MKNKLIKLISELKSRADSYDPRYDGKARGEFIPCTEIEERARYALRNRSVVIGGSHTMPLQAFALRECNAKLNNSGRSITVKVDNLISRFNSADEFFTGTNQHNQVWFYHVYAALMSEQPWEKRKKQ